MGSSSQVTITLPDDLVRHIDRRECDRSGFVAEAVYRELERRSRLDLDQSLENPHLETDAFADHDFEQWWHGLPEEDAESPVDPNFGAAVRWIPGEGWVEEPG